MITFSVIFYYYYYYSHVFAVFDQNHDGTIDFHEFLLAVAAGSPGDLDSHLKYVFEMWEEDYLFVFLFYNIFDLGVMFQEMEKWIFKN